LKHTCKRSTSCSRHRRKKKFIDANLLPFGIKCYRRQCCNLVFRGKRLRSNRCVTRYSSCPTYTRRRCQTRHTRFGCTHVECRNEYLKNGRIVSRGLVRKSHYSCPVTSRKSCNKNYSKNKRCHQKRCCEKFYKGGKLIRSRCKKIGKRFCKRNIKKDVVKSFIKEEN